MIHNCDLWFHHAELQLTEADVVELHKFVAVVEEPKKLAAYAESELLEAELLEIAPHRIVAVAVVDKLGQVELDPVAEEDHKY